jgi:hypothetical protein
MGWSKRELITQAFEQIGLASYVFDLSAEQLQSALRTLDAMVSTWNAPGIRLGYPIPSTSGGSKLTDDSQIPDWANEAVYLNLALRLASTLGKPVSMELKAAAKQGYNVLLSRAAMPPEMQFPSQMPAGAGRKPWRSPTRPFLDDPDKPLETGPDSDFDFE